ncbi:hypothetical protein [Cysteiniphilum sp. QT6929]|uniref:hypothetical protein n=1 Tax=Cysteiniphilum sp. QT6929 TaxID=2975055 RepID=UPI0024B36422|nr:hypothetical protein [Cysteiniphilum sp. QT6929]WHN65957.1 hypothetical protein NYP54_01655 [Cysteiniphilum sp. QT6929]
MIESFYWKQDLLSLIKKIEPKKSPRRWSEKLQVCIEKELILSLFIIRKLIEVNRVSSITKTEKYHIYQAPAITDINNLNYQNIEQNYDYKQRKKVLKDVKFICNQFIHSKLVWAYRDTNRNWSGVITCSDFEIAKFIYDIPIELNFPKFC